MVDVEVTFDYVAEQPDELTIKVGDIIKNVIQSEGGWWEGELKGKKGMFPDNFVSILKDKKEEVKLREPKHNVEATKRQSVKDLASKIKDKVHDGPVPVRKKVKKRAKVVYAYEPENEDELRLSVGEMVDILKQEEEGWWEGIVNGKQGMIPSNFVEVVDESESAAPEPQERAESGEGEGNLIKGKKVHGIGLGNIFGDGPIKLRSTGKKPVDKPTEPPKVERPPQEPVERRPKETKPVEKALVRYSYKAENEDELTLNEGEIITILDKELEDSGWWKGELKDGRVGVFPDNFVDLIEEEVKPHAPAPAPPHPEKAPRPVVTPAAQPKPKRPQPPAQVPGSKPAPKLPDKAPVVEHQKPEPVKEEKPVVIPAKKPPPLTKKPVKPADTHEDKTKPEPTNTTGTFEALEPASEKLTHLTANRARGPAKRPPSQPKPDPTVVKEEERNGEVKDSHWLKEEKTAHVPPTLVERHHEKPHSVPARPSEPPAASPGILLAIEELKREISDLKTNTVSKSAFNELKADNDKLRQELDSVKANNSRRLKDIMAEVDEEKKIRLSTQVEIERIRKLVAESHV